MAVKAMTTPVDPSRHEAIVDNADHHCRRQQREEWAAEIASTKWRRSHDNI
jgi:hypothetical protein